MGKTLDRLGLRDTIAVVVGTRPDIIKQSPVIRELDRRRASFFVLHTGQHYSSNMDDAFFRDLDLKAPDHRLDEPSRHEHHGAQTAAILTGCERVFLEERPSFVLVFGDTNTTLASALAARKLHIPVGHIEAGMRSRDWRMPEEHNRVMVDHISDFLFTPGANARQNLLDEGVVGRIEVVGNTIVEAVAQNAVLARSRGLALEKLSLTEGAYALATAHREENVDDPAQLSTLLDVFETVQKRHELPVVLVAHPRTERRLEEFGLRDRIDAGGSVRIIPATGYLDFLALLQSARILLTDSGGAQQEAALLHVPSVVLRNMTEWVEAVEAGAVRVGGTDAESILRVVNESLESSRDWSSPFGDRTASSRIVESALEHRSAPVTIGT